MDAKHQRIDFIGDIHGYADPLIALLEKLGYSEKNSVWSHSERKVCFLGDYIDRGDKQLSTLTIVKNMVEAGNAYALMGNHELNAIAWLTQRKNKKEASNEDKDTAVFLRQHSDKNRKQHCAFLDQIIENSAEHQAFVNWFYTLPLWIDFGDVRVAHACWHQPSMDRLKPYLTEKNCITPVCIQILYDNKPLFQALETITKGIETALPEGYSFTDKDGTVRRDIRLKWWRTETMNYREAAVVPEKDRPNIPDIPLEADLGYTDNIPVLFGHYWMSGTPHIFAPYAACLDWSIAAKNSKNRKLCAYRWDGERILTNDKLIWVTMG